MMQNRAVSSRDYCEKASPDVAILKKENEGGERNRKETYTAGKNGRKWGQIPHFPKLQ